MAALSDLIISNIGPLIAAMVSVIGIALSSFSPIGYRFRPRARIMKKLFYTEKVEDNLFFDNSKKGWIVPFLTLIIMFAIVMIFSPILAVNTNNFYWFFFPTLLYPLIPISLSEWKDSLKIGPKAALNILGINSVYPVVVAIGTFFTLLLSYSTYAYPAPISSSFPSSVLVDSFFLIIYSVITMAVLTWQERNIEFEIFKEHISSLVVSLTTKYSKIDGKVTDIRSQFVVENSDGRKVLNWNEVEEVTIRTIVSKERS